MIGKIVTARRLKSWRSGDAQFGFMMILPALLLLVLILGYPVFDLFFLSVHTLRQTMPELGMPFVGLQNFLRAFSDPNFWLAIGNTLYFTFYTLLIELIIGVSIAVLMTRVSKFLNVIRGLLLLPWMLMVPVVAVIWCWILNDEYGILNYLLLRLKLIEWPVFWLGTPGLTMKVLVGINIWHQFPIAMIFTIAGLQSIPSELYEAARIDGASSWQEFTQISLPLLRPTILLILLLRTTVALRVFDLIYVTTGGGPAGTTHVFGTYIYENAFVGYDLGYASALSLVLLLITFGISLSYVRLMP